MHPVASLLAPAALVLLCLGLLAAGCGGAPASRVAQLGSTAARSSAGASAPEHRWLGFSRCMRSHGVSRFPDPDSSGTPPKRSAQQLGVSSSQYRSAENACRGLLPNGGRPASQSERQLVRANALRFSECVRSHGVPDFPDPGSDGRIPDPASVGIDQGSPKFQTANEACRTYRPPYLPSNGAYDTWARTHAG